MAVLDRIEMDVIGVAFEVSFVTYQVFPEPTLPYSAFTFHASSGRQPFVFLNASRECRLDRMPAHGKVGIVLRQRPDAMQVVGENDRCVDDKGSFCPHLCKRLAQGVGMFRQQAPLSFKQRNREKNVPPGTCVRM